MCWRVWRVNEATHELIHYINSMYWYLRAHLMLLHLSLFYDITSWIQNNNNYRPFLYSHPQSHLDLPKVLCDRCSYWSILRMRKLRLERVKRLPMMHRGDMLTVGPGVRQTGPCVGELRQPLTFWSLEHGHDGSLFLPSHSQHCRWQRAGELRRKEVSPCIPALPLKLCPLSKAFDLSGFHFLICKLGDNSNCL
jgi:hypothetical protein